MQQLRYVVEVDRHKSITKAAKSLFVSQPRMSTTIRELEEELRTQLFRRTPTGVETTDAGRAFVVDAVDILSKTDSLEQRYGKAAGETERRLRVAGPAADSCDQALALMINDFCAKGIDFKLSYVDQLVFDTIDSVEKGLVDIGIVGCKSSLSRITLTIIEQKKLEFHYLAEYPLCLAVSENHPLASAENIRYEDIIQYPILYSDSDVDDNTPRMIAMAVGGDTPEGRVPTRTVQVVDMLSISKLLQKTNAVYAMSAGSNDLEKSLNSQVVRLPGTLGNMTETRGWIKRKDVPLSETAKLFIHHVNEYFIDYVKKNTL